MTKHSRLPRACAFGMALTFATGLAGAAMASDPYPGDDIALPPGVNLAIAYNYFTNASSFGPADGGHDINHSTRIVDDFVVARYVHYFSVDGFTGGVQAYIPYVGFPGQQELGINASPATFGQTAHANLSSHAGFAQPNFGAALWAINQPASGTYLVLAPWISPPISSFNKNYNLNPGTQNVWTYEMEIGARTILFGGPTTHNLALSLWATGYEYGSNQHSAAVTPSVSIPAFGVTTQQSAVGATFHEQPTLELRAYLPYEVIPALDAFVAPGIYQSFGGKQTYAIHGGPTVDSGNRTNETQLRLVAATFLSPTMQILLSADYDIAAHGGPLNRTLTLRLIKVF